MINSAQQEVTNSTIHECIVVYCSDRDAYISHHDNPS